MPLLWEKQSKWVSILLFGPSTTPHKHDLCCSDTEGPQKDRQKENDASSDAPETACIFFYLTACSICKCFAHGFVKHIWRVFDQKQVKLSSKHPSFWMRET